MGLAAAVVWRPFACRVVGGCGPSVCRHRGGLRPSDLLPPPVSIVASDRDPGAGGLRPTPTAYVGAAARAGGSNPGDLGRRAVTCRGNGSATAVVAAWADGCVG